MDNFRLESHGEAITSNMGQNSTGHKRRNIKVKRQGILQEEGKLDTHNAADVVHLVRVTQVLRLRRRDLSGPPTLS